MEPGNAWRVRLFSGHPCCSRGLCLCWSEIQERPLGEIQCAHDPAIGDDHANSELQQHRRFSRCRTTISSSRPLTADEPIRILMHGMTIYPLAIQIASDH